MRRASGDVRGSLHSGRKDWRRLQLDWAFERSSARKVRRVVPPSGRLSPVLRRVCWVVGVECGGFVPRCLRQVGPLCKWPFVGLRLGGFRFGGTRSSWAPSSGDSPPAKCGAKTPRANYRQPNHVREASSANHRLRTTVREPPSAKRHREPPPAKRLREPPLPKRLREPPLPKRLREPPSAKRALIPNLE